MITSLATISVALTLAQGGMLRHHPKWFDQMLAGYAFAYDEKHTDAAVYDPATRFMLVRDIECDGADLSLILTRDRQEVSSMGYDVPNFTPKKGNDGNQPMMVKSLPSLSTGLGIRIGDSPALVEGRLGRSHNSTHTGSRHQFLNFTYKWQEGYGERGMEYDETYVFKEGKLIEISFAWGPPDGTADAIEPRPALN